jgi:hypothetical protein
MHSCASAAKLRGGGPILQGGPKDHVTLRVATTSDPVPLLVCVGLAHAAGRKMTPTGTSPMVTSCHSAMSSLRASATIMVLRVVRRPSAVRTLNHWARALSFWNLRKRQANCIMPRRTRALPVRARPLSRRRLPLSSSAPVVEGGEGPVRVKRLRHGGSIGSCLNTPRRRCYTPSPLAP